LMIGLVLFLAELKTVDLIGRDDLTESKAAGDLGLIGMMMNELEMASDLNLAAIKAGCDGFFFDDFKAICDKLEDVKKTDSMIIGIKGGDCATKVYFCNGI
jgi:hypothetical protein